MSKIPKQKTINVHDTGKGMFNTWSGLLIDLNNPTADMICISDISHALSRICRFGGHTKRFYSVAEHSVLVAALAPDDLKLEALLHDAAEAYLGDVIKPLKIILGKAYADLEENFEAIIQCKYGLDPDKIKAIKQYDKQALEMEHKAYIMDCNRSAANIHAIIYEETGTPVWLESYAAEMFNTQLEIYYSKRN